MAAAASWDRERAAKMLPQLKRVNDWLGEIGKRSETPSLPPVDRDGEGTAASTAPVLANGGCDVPEETIERPLSPPPSLPPSSELRPPLPAPRPSLSSAGPARVHGMRWPRAHGRGGPAQDPTYRHFSL